MVLADSGVSAPRRAAGSGIPGIGEVERFIGRGEEPRSEAWCMRGRAGMSTRREAAVLEESRRRAEYTDRGLAPHPSSSQNSAGPSHGAPTTGAVAGAGRAQCGESVELFQDDVLVGDAALQGYFRKGGSLVHIRIFSSLGGRSLQGVGM